MERKRIELGFWEAITLIKNELDNIEHNEFKYIYLFGFDNENMLIYADAIAPEFPPNYYKQIISEIKLLITDYESTNYYFIVNVKKYKFDNDIERLKSYFDGFNDMELIIEKANNFIDAYLNSNEKEVEVNPALKRYTIEFINAQLDLPFKYPKYLRLLDALFLKVFSERK